MSDDRILVPVTRSATLRQTVEYAVQTALAGEGESYVRFTYVHPPEAGGGQEQTFASADREELDAAIKSSSELLNRVSVWAGEDAGDEEDRLTVETSQIGRDRYLFSPQDVADAIATEARDAGVNRIILDPEYDPGIGAPFLRPLEVELTRVSDCRIEEASVTVATRRSPLSIGGTPLQIGAIFGISFVFYQILGGTFDFFDLVTGALSATIVAVGLSRVTFSSDPTKYAPRRIARMGVYIPYLLWEIVKSNIQIATVILHPRLPIDPRMTRIKPAVWGGLPVTTLANSITLTPGTLSTRVEGRTLKVHTLVPGAREDLFDGGLERAVRFVFYGRKAMGIPSLREREACEILQPLPNEGISQASTPEESPDDTDEGGDGS